MIRFRKRVVEVEKKFARRRKKMEATERKALKVFTILLLLDIFFSYRLIKKQ
jgi:uncharacterized membrane protein